MSDLVRCVRCRNIMIDEEYQDHLCEPRIQEFKKIKFTSYCIAKNVQGRTLVDITSSDGVSYLFEQIPEDKEFTKIPYQPNGNTNKTTEDETEPHFRCCYLFGWCSSRYLRLL